MNDGTPANVFTDVAYSELVQDKHGVQVFYARSSDDFSIATAVFALISSLASSSGSSQIGYSNGGTAITAEEALDLLYYGVADGRKPKFAGGPDATWATFSTDAFKAAIAASTFVSVPASTNKLDDTITKTTSGASSFPALPMR